MPEEIEVSKLHNVFTFILFYLFAGGLAIQVSTLKNWSCSADYCCPIIIPSGRLM